MKALALTVVWLVVLASCDFIYAEGSDKDEIPDDYIEPRGCNVEDCDYVQCTPRPPPGQAGRCPPSAPYKAGPDISCGPAGSPTIKYKCCRTCKDTSQTVAAIVAGKGK